MHILLGLDGSEPSVVSEKGRVDAIARMLGLVCLGVMYTDLTDDGTGNVKIQVSQSRVQLYANDMENLTFCHLERFYFQRSCNHYIQ